VSEEIITQKIPNIIFARDLKRITSWAMTSTAVITSVDIETFPATEVRFDPPYLLESGKFYGLRDMEGQHQIWEIEARPEVEDEFRWAREAGRMNRTVGEGE
jgi:hypothetical protein